MTKSRLEFKLQPFTLPCEGCKRDPNCSRQWHYALNGDLWVCDQRIPPYPPIQPPLPFFSTAYLDYIAASNHL